MAIFKEAMARLFENVYVCRVCESKFRVARSKVLSGKAKCKKCKSSKIRPVRMKSKK